MLAGTSVFARNGACARPSSWSGPAIALGVSLVSLLVRLSVGPLTVDDAYITFRYARNLASGMGFVYNAGEHVLGTTTPLYAMILAAAYGLGFRDLPQTALAVNAFADGLTTALLYSLAARLGLNRLWSTTLATLFAVNSYSIRFAANGMESSVFSFLVLAAIWADLTERRGLAGLFAGLATLARPDGLIVSALILSRHLLHLRLPPWRTTIAYLLPLIPWLAYATWWFGQPVPQSLIAKSLVYHPALTTNLVTMLFQPNPCGLLAIAAILLLRPLSVCSYLRARPERFALVAFPVVLAGFYTLAGLKGVRVDWFGWYLVPLVPWYLLALVMALAKLRTKMALLRAVVCAGLLVLVALSGHSLGRQGGRSIFTPAGVDVSRESAYISAAQFVAPMVGERTLVALPEIGAFGYITNARILDTVGLVSPEAVRFYPLPDGMREGAMPPGLLESTNPDYIVGLDGHLAPQVVGTEWFGSHYREVARFGTEFLNFHAVLVYQRVP